MKFGKRLASMLFEIYPEADSVKYTEGSGVSVHADGYYCKETYTWCEPPDDEVTEYKREDVFVYGDEVEYKVGNRWDLCEFICYDDDGDIHVYDESVESCLVEKPQKEEMVLINATIINDDNKIYTSQIPLSKAEEMGLI